MKGFITMSSKYVHWNYFFMTASLRIYRQIIKLGGFGENFKFIAYKL